MTKLVSHMEQNLEIILNLADYTSPVFVWTVIELALGVVCACLPTLRPIYLRYSRPQASKLGSLTISYGKSHYVQSRSPDEDFGEALTGPRVQTHIEGLPLGRLREPDESVITVEQGIYSESSGIGGL